MADQSPGPKDAREYKKLYFAEIKSNVSLWNIGMGVVCSINGDTRKDYLKIYFFQSCLKRRAPFPHLAVDNHQKFIKAWKCHVFAESTSVLCGAFCKSQSWDLQL